MTTPTATLRRHAARLLSVRLVFKPARAHFFCFVFLLFFCFALFLLVRKKSERQFLVPRPAATETYQFTATARQATLFLSRSCFCAVAPHCPAVDGAAGLLCISRFVPFGWRAAYFSRRAFAFRVPGI